MPKLKLKSKLKSKSKPKSNTKCKNLILANFNVMSHHYEKFFFVGGEEIYYQYRYASLIRYLKYYLNYYQIDILSLEEVSEELRNLVLRDIANDPFWINYYRYHELLVKSPRFGNHYLITFIKFNRINYILNRCSCTC